MKQALDDDAFAALMAPLGPFEPSPHVAVAVSGGPDSLALALLAADWAAARRGLVTGLTVDHGLRRESAAEARQVGRWLKSAGIEHRILRWKGSKPQTGIQEAARTARLALLAGWCRRATVLHLLVAHHADDQAETVLHRVLRGSGIDGLAAMAPVQLLRMPDGRDVRLLRPLLAVDKSRLALTLTSRGQPWIDDPSNRDQRFARTRVADHLDRLVDGEGPHRLGRTARRAAEDRAALEDMTARWLAAHARIHPAGFMRIDRSAWHTAAPALARRVLVRSLMGVSGAAYPPRLERVDRLQAALGNARCKPATLAGCRIVPAKAEFLIVREPAAARDITIVRRGRPCLWDQRMLVTVRGGVRNRQITVKRLGVAGYARIRSDLAESAVRQGLPPAARPGLPAFFDLEGILSVPHLGFVRADARPKARIEHFSAAFRPAQALGPGGAASIGID